jgi:osmotically-inducible protein OsmY
MVNINKFLSLRVLSLILVPLAMAAAPLQSARAATTGSDAELTSRVQAALSASPQSEDLQDVVVSVRGGVVHLTGWAGEPRDALSATQAVLDADSQMVVDNRIRTWSSSDYQ